MMRAERLAWAFSWTEILNVLWLLLPFSDGEQRSSVNHSSGQHNMISASHCIFSLPSSFQSHHLSYLTAARFQADHTLLVRSYLFPGLLNSWTASDCTCMKCSDTALTEKRSLWAAVVIVAVVFPLVGKPVCIILVVVYVVYCNIWEKHFPDE